MTGSVSYRTPYLAVLDGRSLTVRQVAYLRTVAGTPAQPLITRHLHDVVGRNVAQWDPRLFGSAIKPNLVTIYNLVGEQLKVDSVDAGWRLSLPGPAAETRQRWDARQHHWRMTYDDQLRLINAEEYSQHDTEYFAYADAQADSTHNLRGKLFEQTDPSGVLRFNSFTLSGMPSHEVRLLKNELFSTRRTYSPTGALLTQTDAGGHRQQMRYTVAGQLRQVSLKISNHPEQPVLLDVRYNAAGEIEQQTTANGVVSIWRYDPASGFLSTHKSTKPGQVPQQDLSYCHDPMGNVLSIKDHTLATVYFANQRVDSRRDFIYDSLYRLISASGFEAQVPNLDPGLPVLISPIDSGRRYNYREDYDYDRGNNLVALRHVREGNTYTRQMRVDDHGNRAVRWAQGDNDPVFNEYFDAHGNAIKLQAGGLPLNWNAREQLVSVTLLKHGNGLPDDEETHIYSQGERVFKRHVSHTPSVTHSREVRYLPGLEIQTCSDGETLQVISLALGLGSARCLHWIGSPPTGVEPDQLRYHCEDHLGSCTVELDRHGALISLEFYYPYGGTAWWAARSIVEAVYKTLRYSGKEMDLSGLYYYGARYYAPWLQRWISADPAGDVDGLNLYLLVNDNPLRFIDLGGTNQEESAARQQITEYSNLLSQVNSELKKLNYQLYNLTRTRDIYKTAGKKLAFSMVTFFAAIQAGAVGTAVGGAVGSLTGPAAPVVVPVTSAIGGIMAAEATVRAMEKLGEETSLGYTIMPDPAALSVKSLKSKASAAPFSINTVVNSFSLETSQGLVKTGIETTARVLGKHLKIPYLKQSLNVVRQMAQLTEALNDSWGQGSLDQIGLRLDELSSFLNSEEAKAMGNFDILTDAQPGPVKLIGIAQMPQASTGDQPTLEQEMIVARASIVQARRLLGRVSAWIAEKPRAA